MHTQLSEAPKGADCHRMSTEIAAMVKALRERLGLSQQAVADRGGFPRPQLAKIETGHNKLSTADMRRQLALGLGVTVRTLEAYIEGGMTLDDAVSTVTGPEAQTTAIADTDDGRAIGHALVQAIKPGRHELEDLDAVRSLLKGVELLQDERDGFDLVGAAGRWLDAAAYLRRRGRSVTAGAVLVQSTAAPESFIERAAAANAEGDRKARELGVEPGSAAKALNALRRRS